MILLVIIRTDTATKPPEESLSRDEIMIVVARLTPFFLYLEYSYIGKDSALSLYISQIVLILIQSM